MDADAETSVDAVLLKQPLHGHQHQMQVVDRRALDHPVHSAGDELKQSEEVELESSAIQTRFPSET